MNLAIPKAHLSRAVAGLRLAVEPRSTLRLLKCVEILASEEGLVRLSATDLDVLMAYTVPVEKAETPLGQKILAERWKRQKGRVLVPFDVLQEAVSRCDRDGAVSFAVEGDKVVVTPRVQGQSSPVKVPAIDPSEWPRFPIFAALDAADRAAVTGEAITCGLECAADDEQRFVLNGICFDHLGHAIAGTDGRCLYRHNSFAFPWQPKGGSWIAPKHRALRWLAANSKTLRVAFAEGKRDEPVWLIEVGPWQCRGKGLCGIFPNYKQVIPTAFRVGVEVAERELARLAEALARFPLNRAEDGKPRADIGAKGINLRVTAKGFTVTGDHKDGPEIVVPATVTFRPAVKAKKGKEAVPAGAPFTLHINRDFVIRAARWGLPSWGFNGSDHPMVASSVRAVFVAMHLSRKP